MNIRINIIAFIVLFSCCGIQAQTKIKGKITDNKRETYAGVSVILQTLPDSTIIGYTFSDENGYYTISYQEQAKELTLSIAGLQIAPQSKDILNKSQDVDFIIEQKEIELKEVIVKSTKMWGEKDTVNYLVSVFSDKNDIVIGDILKKMPGIDVSDDGAIKYQGKPINNFYIENLDLLGGRYGIASNNIAAQDVSTVQILENHQPIKALDGMKVSTDVAVNLKLKEGAKGVFSIMAQLGVGASPLLWENEINGMYFSKKKQSISTYKGNNSGQDLSKELKSFYSQNSFGQSNMLNVMLPSPPSISQNRFLDNNSNAFTINNLFKTGEDKQLNFNVIYLNDHENRKSNSRTSYFLPDGSALIITEDLRSATNSDRLETEIRYNENNKDNYLNNLVNIQGLWTNTTGHVTNEQEINQYFTNPVFTLTNMFHWVKKKNENKGFDIQSSLGFKSSPQTLTITPGLYQDIFNEGVKYSALQQNTRINNFYIKNKLTLLSSWVLGNVFIDPKFEFGAETKNLTSDVQLVDQNSKTFYLQTDSFINRINWFKSYGGAALLFRYKYTGLDVNVLFPIVYNYMHIDDKIILENNVRNQVFFEPSLDIKYSLTNKMEINGKYSFFNNYGDINSLYTGYIIQNYRSLNHYNNRLSTLNGNGGSINILYKDIMNMFFMSGGVFYNHLKSDILYGQNFQGILTLTSAMVQDNVSNAISVNGRISKSFNLMNIVASLETLYGTYSSEQFRQNDLVIFRNNVLNTTGSLSCIPLSWFSVLYKGTYSSNWNKIKSEKAFSPIKTFINNVSANVMLPKNISLNVNYEHYYNSAIIGNRYLSFADLSLMYTWKSVNLSINWTNIFNTDNYISAYNSNINSYYQNYEIRDTNILLKIRMKLNKS